MARSRHHGFRARRSLTVLSFAIVPAFLFFTTFVQRSNVSGYVICRRDRISSRVERAKKKEKKASDSLRVSLEMPCIWGSDDEVESEVIKTEVLVFNRRREVLKAAKCATISIAEQTFAIK
jgi:hypothetical protein